MFHKTYVDVSAVFTKEGDIRPATVIWMDGRKYEIEKILEVRPAASLKVGGKGIRYTVRIKNKVTYLFLEDQKWFVESK